MTTPDEQIATAAARLSVLGAELIKTAEMLSAAAQINPPGPIEPPTPVEPPESVDPPATPCEISIIDAPSSAAPGRVITYRLSSNAGDEWNTWLVNEAGEWVPGQIVDPVDPVGSYRMQIPSRITRGPYRIWYKSISAGPCFGWESHHPINIAGDAVEAPALILPPITTDLGLKPPGPVARLFGSPENPIKVPANFIGNHICVDIERYLRPAWGGSAMPIPQYPCKWVRGLTASAQGGHGAEVEILSQANIERNGVQDWSASDRWFASPQVAGRPVLWPIFLTPRELSEWPTEPTMWPSWPGTAGAPRREYMPRLAQFVAAVVKRYGPRLIGLEVWNEPLFDWRRPGVFNDSARASPAFLSAVKAHGTGNRTFSSSSPTMYANMAAVIKRNAGKIPVYGFGFESPSDSTVSRLMAAPVDLPGFSGFGADYLDGLSGHFYADKTEGVAAAIDEYRSLAGSKMTGKPFLLTEGGAYHDGTPERTGRWYLGAALSGAQGAAIFGHLPQPMAAAHTGGLPTNHGPAVVVMRDLDRLNGASIYGAQLTDGRYWAVADGKPMVY